MPAVTCPVAFAGERIEWGLDLRVRWAGGNLFCQLSCRFTSAHARETAVVGGGGKILDLAPLCPALCLKVSYLTRLPFANLA